MPDNLHYTHREDGIHLLYWGDVTPQTIETYVKLFTGLHDAVPQNSVMRILHDYRDTGTPSFNTIANAMKDFKLRDDLTLRIAHLYSDVMYPMLMKNASIVARFSANRRFFNANEEDVAITWLLDSAAME